MSMNVELYYEAKKNIISMIIHITWDNENKNKLGKKYEKYELLHERSQINLMKTLLRSF